MQRSGLIFLTLAVSMWCGNSLAHTSSEGEKFTADYNPHGAVLSSEDTVIFLDSSCSADSTTYGSGTWEWSNGGFTINLEKKSFGFPRQEIDINDQSKCQAGMNDPEPVARQANQPTHSKPQPTPGPSIKKVYAICTQDQLETGQSASDAKAMCECVIAPLKKGELTVDSDFMAMAGFYKKMQYVCAVDSGPEGFLKQLGD
jgi:hypothetical protein